MDTRQMNKEEKSKEVKMRKTFSKLHDYHALRHPLKEVNEVDDVSEK